MKIDRLIPKEIHDHPEDRRVARLVLYAMGVAQLATVLVAGMLMIIGHQTTGLVLLSSVFVYFLPLAALHLSRSPRVAAHCFMILLFVVLTLDFGSDSGYGIMAGIALPVAAASLIGVQGAFVWMAIGVAWQVYFGPVVVRPDDFSVEAGFGAAVMTLAVGIASAVVERLRAEAMREAREQRDRLQAYSDRIRHFAERTFPARLEFAGGAAQILSDGLDATLGYDHGSINAENLFDFLHPDDLARLQRRVTVDGRDGFRDEIRIRHADGQWVWLELFGLPLPRHDMGGGWMFMARDANAEIDSRNRLLQAQKLESVGTLAAGLAHDFNNLLAIVVGHASLLPAGEDRNQILNASDQATELIQTLQAFGRGSDSTTKVIDAVAVARSVIAMSERLLEERIVLSGDYLVGAAHVRLQQGALDQLLLNLINNAKDAIEGAGAIQLSVARSDEDDGFAIQVRDDGHGMDAAVLNRAFEPFFTTKPIHQASGLGLASAYGIVQRAGGTLTLDSTPGLGTTATVHLPEASLEPVITDELLGTVRNGFGGISCVLVEDEPAVRKVLARCLATLQVEVFETDNAAEAMQLVQTHNPDLVVSDIVMPGMRGTEMAERLRLEHPSLPVLLVSGYDQGRRSSALSADPMIRFLAKPVRMPDLARQLDELLVAAKSHKNIPGETTESGNSALA